MNEADVFELNRDYVTYEDFGAIGDGKTEDFGRFT